MSVAAARQALEAGRVSVAGPRVEVGRTAAPDSIVFEDDRVTLDGITVVPRTEHDYFILNKPAGVTSTTASPERERDLSEFLRVMPAGVFPVGRLDRATTGLMLCTSDGELATSVLRPDHATEKLYWLWVDERLEDEDPRLTTLVSGVWIPAGLARAAAVKIVARSVDFTELHVTLHSGMNRQIRRMCFALGLRLVHLHRKRIGTLELGALPVGSSRPLTRDEVDAVWCSVGGRSQVRQRRIAALHRDAMRARARGAPLGRLESWLAATG